MHLMNAIIKVQTCSTLQPLVEVVTMTLSPHSAANGMLSFKRLDAPLEADPLTACAATKQRDRWEGRCCCRLLSAGWLANPIPRMPLTPGIMPPDGLLCTALDRPTAPWIMSIAQSNTPSPRMPTLTIDARPSRGWS